MFELLKKKLSLVFSYSTGTHLPSLQSPLHSLKQQHLLLLVARLQVVFLMLYVDRENKVVDADFALNPFRARTKEFILLDGRR